MGSEPNRHMPPARGSADGEASESLHDSSRERDILAEAQEMVRIGAWEWKVGTDEVRWSKEVYRIYGYQPHEFEATLQTFNDHVHPEDRRGLWEDVEEALAGKHELDFRHRIIRTDGSIRYVRERGRVTRDEQGLSVRMLGTVLDVTDEVLLQIERDSLLKSLAESEQRYRLLAENAWDVIWTMELDGTISYVSPSVERVRGLTPAEAMAQSPEEIQPPESVASGADYYRRLFAAIESGAELPQFHGEQEYYRKDGSIMYGELDVIPQVDDDGTVLRILGVTRDISERKRLEAELHRLARTDPLTGVSNRRHTEELLTASIDEARRFNYPLALLMLDIDRFKDVNDAHGHQTGDDVLLELTRRLGEHLRGSDLIGRWGGEEFVIMSGHCTLDEARAVAETLRQAISQTPFDRGGHVTVSIGVAELRDSDNLASWIGRADQAMYDAKDAGRNTVKTGT